jgi:hypothetical protein
MLPRVSVACLSLLPHASFLPSISLYQSSNPPCESRESRQSSIASYSRHAFSTFRRLPAGTRQIAAMILPRLRISRCMPHSPSSGVDEAPQNHICFSEKLAPKVGAGPWKCATQAWLVVPRDPWILHYIRMCSSVIMCLQLGL